MTAKNKRVIYIIIGILVAFSIVIGINTVSNLSPNKDEAYLYIDYDDDIDSVRAKLKQADAGVSMLAFNMLNLYTGYSHHIRPGIYRITDDISTLQLFRDLRNHNSNPVRLVLPSVRTVNDLAGRLGHQLMLDSATIAHALTDADFCDSIGYSRETVPTLFIPNTYEVYWETSLNDFINRMKTENDRFWTGERMNLADEIGMTKAEVMTLASIVDSETANNAEKPRIAGLYMNRLNRGMLLQSDPTVIFAVGDFSIRRVVGKHLSVDSPYNTYKYKGLPPGPIRIASIAGIDAVLSYEHNNYIYMCAKEDFSGTHNFASSWAEHSANARRYAQALNKRGIR